ncbi:MAG: hypothetical protein QM762_13975 [Chryseolinea sp.]
MRKDFFNRAVIERLFFGLKGWVNLQAGEASSFDAFCEHPDQNIPLSPWSINPFSIHFVPAYRSDYAQ